MALNRTRIEWVRNPDGSQGFTWNPVTGCLHPCRNTYCYARKIAERRAGIYHKPQEIYTLNYLSLSIKTYPYGFHPTFYPQRLDEPLGRKKPATIFVCSMADLFGKWVPTEWIKAVLETARACPQHTFIFLTKNPERYQEFDWPANAWLGATATDQASWDRALRAFYVTSDSLLCSGGGKSARHYFISAEPLLGLIIPEDIALLSWLLIGANSNRGAEKPQSGWLEELLLDARAADVPVFVKTNWPHQYRSWPQDFPEEMNG